MNARARFVGWLNNRVGNAVVLWRGKGYFLFDVSAPGCLLAHGYACEVYDCSGSVTCALQAIGGPDLRATHNAASLAKASELIRFDDAKPGDLLFFGSDPLKPDHVAVAVGTKELVMSADGATSHQLEFDVARSNKHARINIHEGPHFRGDYIGTHRNRWLDDMEAKEHGTVNAC